jgi:hypothetical protein
MGGWRTPATSNYPNKRPWPKPLGYDEALASGRWEWRIRQAGGLAAFKANQNFRPINVAGRTMQDKSDVNNDSGQWQTIYPTADNATRTTIRSQLESEWYGWLYFCYTEGSDGCRAYMDQYGCCLDEFVVPSASTNNTRGLPWTFYRREFKRLKFPRFMMKQQNTQEDAVRPDAVACDFYSLDNHVNRRIAQNVDGTPYTQGGLAGYILDCFSIGIPTVSRQVTPGYNTPLDAMLPMECDNLIVPNNMGATNVAMSSLRIDVWKANRGSVAGYVAAKSARTATPMFKLVVADIQTETVALGNIIVPNVPTTGMGLMALGAPAFPEEPFVDTVHDINVMMSHGYHQEYRHAA